jgi:hypothetical protein
LLHKVLEDKGMVQTQTNKTAVDGTGFTFNK